MSEKSYKIVAVKSKMIRVKGINVYKKVSKTIHLKGGQSISEFMNKYKAMKDSKEYEEVYLVEMTKIYKIIEGVRI